jgi:hypothetical protein
MVLHQFLKMVILFSPNRHPITPFYVILRSFRFWLAGVHPALLILVLRKVKLLISIVVLMLDLLF